MDTLYSCVAFLSFPFFSDLNQQNTMGDER